MNRQVKFPYHFDTYGRTAVTGEDDHIRDLVAQVLFTSPGERVNRPDFGTGLLQMVFAPASSELSTALQFLIQGSLQRWLGDLITVDLVTVEVEDSTLRVVVRYVVRRTQQQRVETFTRTVPS